MMVDVDNLKNLNDTAGHHAGDEALRSVSAGLLKAARGSDVVGRLGGDEFAVLLTETSQEQMPAVVERLREVLYAAKGESVPRRTTVSLGSTAWTGAGDSAPEMLRRADQAMYAAKHAGRDRSVAWEPSLVRSGAS